MADTPTTAVFGGSFDPPHVGHAMVVSWLLWTRSARRVLLVPTFQHPFEKALSPFSFRVELCEILAGLLGRGVAVSSVEAELPRPSYTLDTLERLSRELAGSRLRLVVGADTLAQVHLWHRWDEIRARFDPLVVGRAGHPCPPRVPVFPAISSTQVREMRSRGEAVDHLVPAAILERWLEGP